VNEGEAALFFFRIFLKLRPKTTIIRVNTEAASRFNGSGSEGAVDVGVTEGVAVGLTSGENDGVSEGDGEDGASSSPISKETVSEIPVAPSALVA
jgi:hypothetical protein